MSTQNRSYSSTIYVCKGLDDKTKCIVFPIYGFCIIGAIFLILISIIIYLFIKEYRRKRRTYSTFESKQSDTQPCLINDDETSLINHFKECNKKFDNKAFVLKTDEKLENKKMHHSDLEPEQKINRALEMVKKNNPNHAPVLSPVQIKKLCDEVLNITLKKQSDKTEHYNNQQKGNNVKEINNIDLNKVDENEDAKKKNVKELNKNIEEILKRKNDNELYKMPKFLLRKSLSVCDLSLYDVVRNPKPVNNEVYDTVDDITLIRPRLKSYKVIYEGLYKFPLKVKTNYANANVV